MRHAIAAWALIGFFALTPRADADFIHGHDFVSHVEHAAPDKSHDLPHLALHASHPQPLSGLNLNHATLNCHPQFDCKDLHFGDRPNPFLGGIGGHCHPIFHCFRHPHPPHHPGHCFPPPPHCGDPQPVPVPSGLILAFTALPGLGLGSVLMRRTKKMNPRIENTSAQR